MSRLQLCLWLAALILSQASVVRAQVTLQHKFPDGRKTTTLVKVSSHQVLTINQDRHEVRSEQEMVVAVDNGIRDKDGELRQRHRIESLKAKLAMPGGVVLEFDSSVAKPTPAGTKYDQFLDLIKINAGASWSLTRDKDNRVRSVDGRDSVLEPLDQAKRELVKRQVDANYLRDRANQEMLKVPATPLKVGDVWELSDVTNMDAGQALTMKLAYTYQGEVDRGDRKVHQIDVKMRNVEYSVDRDASTTLKLVSSRLQPTMIEGVIYFDAEQGQIVESRESVRIVGDITYNLLGNDLVGSLDLTMATSAVIQ